MFKYEDIPEHWTYSRWLDDKLEEAATYDPLVRACYNIFVPKFKGTDPFCSPLFYKFLAYTALKGRDEVMTAYLKSVQRQINPPIILRYVDTFLPKELKDELEKMRDTRSWHQKMIDKLFKRRIRDEA